MKTFTLYPGEMTLTDLYHFITEPCQLVLANDCRAAIDESAEIIKQVLQKGETVYGINTGFGLLASTRIPADQLEQLQHSLIMSHAAGIGKILPDKVVRLIFLLKINSLARGYSGVRYTVIEYLLQFCNAGMYPCIPEKGSVGASGDLAPLAHLSAVLLGIGQVRYKDEIISAKKALAELGLAPLVLAPKEGLALLNGTQVSTALALVGLFACESIFAAAVLAGSLSLDAATGSIKPFDARIHASRGHLGQQQVAKAYLNLLKDSEIVASHKTCSRVQDPYSLRCQPQVMGACLDHLSFAAKTLQIEANAVTDNPLIFADTKEIISGGNFHAEPVAMAADVLALCLAEIGALAERRIALLMDHHLSGLPPFLVKESGVNSGFMIAQVTAAALASENKVFAHPACVDSLPTSANQEDHVSMATFAARRLIDMAENSAGIVAIELLAACQGVEFHLEKTSPALQKVLAKIRQYVAHYTQDRYMAADIEAILALVQKGEFRGLLPFKLLPSQQ